MTPRPLVLLPLTVAAALAQANAPDGRPVLNSFVNHRVADTTSLLAHVRKDPVVADRYRRHFAMDQASLLRYLGGLHRGALANDGVFTIYSVPQGGRLKMHVGKLRRGEPMFLDRRGAPVLVVKCGNPVVLGPARPRPSTPTAVAILNERAPRPLPLAEAQTSTDELLASVPAVPTVVPETATVVAEPAVAVVPASSTGGSTNLGWLGSIVGIFGAVSNDGPKDVTNPVPEPASLLALAAGAAALARRRRRP